MHHKEHKEHKEKEFLDFFCHEPRGLSYDIIGAAIEVHKVLGPGLLESTYESCLGYELIQRGISFQRQLALPVTYKGTLIDASYRIDFLVENTVILELKSIEKLLPIHEAQIATYLKLSNVKVGILINFNVLQLMDGIKRIVI